MLFRRKAAGLPGSDGPDGRKSGEEGKPGVGTEIARENFEILVFGTRPAVSALRQETETELTPTLNNKGGEFFRR